jgi:hypothetical protein
MLSSPTTIILYLLFTLVALSFQESCLVFAKKGNDDNNMGDNKVIQKQAKKGGAGNGEGVDKNYIIKNARTEGGKKVTQKEATTTVANLNAKNITLEEIYFFDQAWLTAFNSVYNTNSTDDNDLTAIAVEMEDVKMRPEPDDNNRRQLRGYFNYFDFYIRIDFRCRFCSDYRRTLKSNKNSSKSDKKKRAPVQALHQAFERTLCDVLREGPYNVYRNVRQCQVTFVNN